jgi:hypothetical protein
MRVSDTVEVASLRSAAGLDAPAAAVKPTSRVSGIVAALATRTTRVEAASPARSGNRVVPSVPTSSHVALTGVHFHSAPSRVVSARTSERFGARSGSDMVTGATRSVPPPFHTETSTIACAFGAIGVAAFAVVTIAGAAAIAAFAAIGATSMIAAVATT